MPAVASPVVDVYPYRVHPEGPLPSFGRRGVPSGTLAFPEGNLRFLLLRRAAGRVYAGQWRMVGGKVEGQERAWEAALRELREETGLSPRRLWALPSVNTFYDPTRDAVVLAPAFAAEVEADPTLDAEHDVFAWLTPEAAIERLAWPERRRLLAMASDLLHSGAVPPELEIGGAAAVRSPGAPLP